MKTILFFGIIALAFSATQTAYGQKPHTQPAPQPPPQPVRIAHHFEPLPRTEGSLAIDTTTGRMCRTWAWVCAHNSIQNIYNNESMENSVYGITCSAIMNIPTCAELTYDYAGQQ